MNEDAIAEDVAIDSDQPITMDEAETESSPEQEEKPEQKTDGVHKRINELTAKRYEQQRRAEAAESELSELRKAQAQPATEVAQAPQLPEDVYDSEAMAEYHNSMVAHQTTVAQGAVQQALQDTRTQDLQSQQTAAMQQVVSTYTNNAINDGVDMDKLRAAEQVLNQEGIDPGLGQFIMNDPHGGKIAEYLHDNPAVRLDLLDLDPISAGYKIMNEVEALALSTTPKVSNAPDPIPEIRGGGALDKDDFDRNNPGTEFI